MVCQVFFNELPPSACYCDHSLHGTGFRCFFSQFDVDYNHHFQPERGTYMDDKVKELLERIRETAGAAADTAADTARAAGRKAGQVVDIAKLNVQLFDLNGEYSEVLRQLGQVLYDTHRGREEDGEKITALLEHADEINGRIGELKERIAALRQSKTCPTCGAVCGREDSFCRRCGTPL